MTQLSMVAITFVMIGLCNTLSKAYITHLMGSTEASEPSKPKREITKITNSQNT